MFFYVSARSAAAVVVAVVAVSVSRVLFVVANKLRYSIHVVSVKEGSLVVETDLHGSGVLVVVVLVLVVVVVVAVEEVPVVVLFVLLPVVVSW